MLAGSGIDPMQLIYAIATVNSLVLAGVLWRYRDRRGALPLFAVNLGAAVWAGSTFALTIVDTGSIAHLILACLFLGVELASVGTLVFTLEYTGRERYVRPSVLAALSIEPILTLLFVVVNPNDLFFSVTADGVAEWGIAAALHTLYSYVILIVVTVLMLEFLYRSRSLYRGQSAALLGGTLATWIANAVYMVGLVEFDTSPIGFLVTGLLYAIAIVRYRLADLTPIARDRVLDTVTDGVYVVDERDRLIDINPVGRYLLADADGSLIGQRVDSLFADWPDLQDEYRSLTATPETTERELEVDGEYFLVRATPIDDGRDRHLGWLFVVRDITERKRREEQLERQNERLERFADVVSHDLRNPLSVAEGYVDLAVETGDMSHLEKVQESHDRMEAIIEDVLALAREGEAVGETESVELGAVARQAWENVDTGDHELSIGGSAVVLADRTRLLRLLENLFRNAVEHGSTSPRSQPREDAVEHGKPSADAEGLDDTAESESPLTVSVGVLGTNPVYGFYVADDGCGLPDDEQIFEQGYTTNEDGTGFGLSIVEQIATAHDWTIGATESKEGGARFELAGVETVAPDSDENRADDGSLETPSPSGNSS